MEQIKFRAWDKTSKIMLDVVSVVFIGGVTDQKIVMQTPDKPHEQWNSFRDQVEIMQFTGLLDKNGKEIFEGDIIKTNEGLRFVVEDSGGFGTENKEDYGKDWLNVSSFEWLIETIENKGGVEVIGNVFENSDLLK